MMKDQNKKTAEGSNGGKGDAPRNCFSDQYRANYESIFRKRIEKKPKENPTK